MGGVAAGAHVAGEGGDVAGVEGEGVVAFAAHHDIGAAVAGEGVVAVAGDEGFCRGGAGEGVGGGVTEVVDGGGELLAAEDYVGFAGVDRRAYVSLFWLNATQLASAVAWRVC